MANITSLQNEVQQHHICEANASLKYPEFYDTMSFAVIVMKTILDELNVPSKIWLLHHNVKKTPHTILTFEAEEKLVYLELTPQSNKPWYGKEILYENEHSFVDSFQKDDFTIIEITNQIIIGSHPDSLLQHLPQQY